MANIRLRHLGHHSRQHQMGRFQLASSLITGEDTRRNHIAPHRWPPRCRSRHFPDFRLPRPKESNEQRDLDMADAGRNFQTSHRPSFLIFLRRKSRSFRDSYCSESFHSVKFSLICFILQAPAPVNIFLAPDSFIFCCVSTVTLPLPPEKYGKDSANNPPSAPFL